MKKILLFLALVLAVVQVEAQRKISWHEASAERLSSLQKIRQGDYSANQQLLEFDLPALKQSLVGAPESRTSSTGLMISLPTTNGTEDFMIWETSNFAPELRAQYPDIKSYVGKGVTDKSAYIRFSIGPTHGLSTMILRADSGSEFIEAFTTDRSVYVMFDSKTRMKNSLPLNCGTDEIAANQDAVASTSGMARLADNQVFRTYRLALSCTGEYTTYHGGTVAAALEGMNATMTRVNGVLDVDMAVKLEIIPTTNLVIFLNAGSDPYSNAAVGSIPANANNSTGWGIQLQNTLTNLIGNANYDIGHLFGASGGGGIAGCIGCICEDDTAATNDKHKGAGFTSPSDDIPEGDNFDIDFVIHEMGHQLGATHTFSHQVEGAGTNIELASGVTIMGYAGVTQFWDVQPHSLAYFAYRSIIQMQTNLALGTHNCSTNVPLAGVNAAPVVSAGTDWTIPNGTAFILTGTGSDADGDSLTYVWEQNDAGTAATTEDNSIAFPTKATGPTFRSYLPTSSPVRIMPQMSAVLSGQLEGTWESVSAIGRNLNFNFTARDNHPNAGQTKKDANVITVSPTIGPFEVTSQNTFGLSWQQGSSQNITWNVAGSATLLGSTNVDIKLSTDGGVTWPTVLASNTPNDGSETITVPSITGENCRIWIQPTGNIYFAVNSTPFSIGYSCNVTSATPNLAVPDGTAPNTGGAIVQTTMTVANAGTVVSANMKVNLSITHGYMGDLVIKLKDPANTTRTLLQRPCNSVGGFANANLTLKDGTGALQCLAAPLSGTCQAFQNFTSFNGHATNGTWTLTAQDFYNGDAGTVVSWGLDFGCVLGNPIFEESNFVLYPNPNSGTFSIEYTSPIANDVNIFVHDMRGRLVFQNKYTNTGLFIQNVVLNSAEAGIYLVTVQDGNKKMVKKIVIE